MIRIPEFRALARAVAAAGLAFAALAAAPAGAATITISDSSLTPDQTVCPRPDGSARAAIAVNAFSAVANADAQIARVLVRLVPADAYASLERVELRSGDMATVYGSMIPTTDYFWMNLSTPLPVTASPAVFNLAIVQRQHADMPPPATGKSFAVRAEVAQVLSYGNAANGSDSLSRTITIDNGSPANVVWDSITSGATSITLDWAGTPDPSVLVLRREIGPVENAPVEGATYSAGAMYGTSRVVFAATGALATDSSLTAGRPYYYRVFTRDTCGNYSSGTSLGPIYPGGSAEGDLTLNSTKPVVGIVNPGNGPVTRPFKVQIRVFSPGAAPITEVRLYGNSGTGDVLLGTTTGGSPAVTRNSNFGNDAASGMYEYTATEAFAEGTWTLRAQAFNATGGVYSGGVGVIVSANKGDGRLLVRDNSAQLCADCHAAKTHSSEATGMGLGSWYVGCRGCHEPHGTTNAKLIAKEITPPSVNGAQAPQPVFFTGAGGNVVGGKVNPQGTGLCQVCHTRTEFFRRGVANQTHGDGAPCANCHSHQEGQAADCSSCHGDKNRLAVAGADAMVSAAPPQAAAPVGGNDVGAHQAHVNQATFRADPLACANCHTIPNQHQGAADVLSFAGLASNLTTPVWNSGASTCASTYCHAGPPARSFEGTNRTPSWTAATTLTCQSCHLSPPGGAHTTDTACATCHGTGYEIGAVSGAARVTHIDGAVQATNCTGCHGTEGVNAAPPVAAAPVGANNVGAHQAHVASTNFRTDPLPCSECHVSYPTGHNDGAQNVAFGALSTTGAMSPTYQGISTPANPTCSSTYCHARPGASTPAPNWSTAVSPACNSCHGNPVPHPHPSNPSCGNCHPGYGAAVVVKATHIDGLKTKSTSNCTSCHGDLAQAANVVTSASPTLAAPGANAVATSKDTAGQTATISSGVGAHRAHLFKTNMRAAALACSECHGAIPADGNTSHGTDAGTGGARASLTWGTLARGAIDSWSGSVTPGYAGSTTGAGGTTGGTCSSSYCHGNFRNSGNATASVSWPGAYSATLTDTSLTCGSCHGAIPPAPHPQNSACGSCHPGYGATTVAKTTHMDGLLTRDATRAGCTQCHGDPARAGIAGADSNIKAAPPIDATGDTAVTARGVGAHAAHVNANSFRSNPIGCGECHAGAVPTGSDTTHANGTVAIAGGALALTNSWGNAGTAQALTWSGTTCANTYCHGNFPNGKNTTITWAQDVTLDCNSCHGRGTGATATPPGGTHADDSACGNCHPGYTATTVVAATHINGQLDGGISSGGQACTGCHDPIYQAMTSATHRHTMSASGAALAPNTGAYPTGTNAQACVQCHMDHNAFNASPAANLRNSATVTGPTATATDHSAGSGVCVSCHGTSSFAKASGGTTPQVNGTTYSASAHDYATDPTSTFTKGGTFSANCSKCHNDTSTKKYQTVSNQFALHDSSQASLLAPLGSSAASPLEENACYRCHSKAADDIGGTKKSADADDWYGAVNNMSVGSTGIYAVMPKTPAINGATRLYFRETNTSGTSQNASGSTDTFQGGTWQKRDMTATNGTTAQSQVVTINNTGNPRYWRMTSFVSPAVTSATTIDAGTWNLRLWAQESDIGANARIRATIYVWTAAGARGATIVAPTSHASELTTTSTAYALALSGSAVTLGVGDRVVCEVEVDTRTPTATTFTATFRWNSSTNDSYMELPSGGRSGHNVASYSGVHRTNPADETSTYLRDNKHVECADCHNPHGAKAGLHAVRSNVAGGVLTGASGVVPTIPTTNWNTTTPITYTTTSVGAASLEAYVCFKCHSNYNAAIPAHPGTSAAPQNATGQWSVGGGGFTNVALEFSTANASYHPVLNALPATDPGTNGSNQLPVAGRVLSPWVRGDRMACTDCHGAEAAAPAAQGPHGSAYPFMLKGTNKRWPYQANGTTLWALNNTSTAVGTSDGLFCMNCHPNPASSNTIHSGYLAETRTDHSANWQCVKCHIRIPHGGKVSRLIVTANAPARYKVAGQTPVLDWVSKPTTGSMTMSNINDSGACNRHSGASSGESW